MKSWPYFLLALIVIAGTWFRIAGIITNSFSFTYDIGRDMLEVSKIVNDHKFTLIGPTTGLAGLFYGPWWYYILSIPFFISDGNPQSIAFFISFTGILTIIFIYYLGKKIEGDFLGLVLAFFIALSPPMIGISSQIWNPNLIPLFILLVLLLMHKIFLAIIVRKNSIEKYFLFLGLLLGLILDHEIVFGAIFSIGIFLSIFILFAKNVKIKHIFFVLLGFLFIILPRLLFEMRHNFIMTKTIINTINNSKGLLNNSLFSYAHIIDLLKTLRNLLDSTFAVQNAYVGFIAILLFLLVALFYKSIDQYTKFYLKLTLIIFTVFLIILSFFPGAIWSHYIIGIPILFILMMGLFVSVIKKYFNIPILIIFIIFTIWFMIYLNNIKFFSSFDNLWEGNAAVYRNQVAIIDYIYKNSNGKKFNYVAYTPVVHDYTYQYLFSWYGKKKYGYTPSNSHEKNFFLIIEPDYDHPFFLKRWLNVRKDDGKTLKEEVVKGEIKVQTRIH